MISQLQRAVQCIRANGCLVYPTETVYGLGAKALSEAAAGRIARIKSRQAGKPFPVIIGSLEQLSAVTAWQDETFFSLARMFWPGPLSILVPARREISALAQDSEGWTSLRVSSHPIARRLCLESGLPLLATSANQSGCEPAARPEDLDPVVLEKVDCFVPGPPYPPGGLPSTVVRICGTAALSVLRRGALALSELEKAGFRVQRGSSRL